MSTHSIAATASLQRADGERRHRILLTAGYVFVISALLGIAWYGRDYYWLDAAQRPFSPKHAALKPSGSVGIRLGLIGLGLFVAIFLYPLRKRWQWLASKGSTRHWMDFHILFGLTAPFLIALHSSFKFQGFAGMAFWIMVAVSASGVIGRYLYGQIPRRVNAAELSLKESHDLRQQLVNDLANQKWFKARDLGTVFRLPDATTVSRLPIVVSLVYMVALDIARPFRIARLRARVLSTGQLFLTCGGLFSTDNAELERVIRLAREQASLSKRLLFLARAQRVFHLWHVIHKPFSYSFAVLALVHILVVFLLGYM